MEEKMMANDNREVRKEYIAEMNRIGIELVDLVAKMSSTLTDFDSVLEVQKAINHIAMAGTICIYNDKIEDTIAEENKFDD